MQTRYRIPLLDPTPEIDESAEELFSAMIGVLRSGRYILGPQVSSFEEELSEFLGVRHVVGVNSGTDALVISLRALDIQPGDEVLTTPFTFFATAEAVSAIGATPVFVDIDPHTFNIDPTRVESAITSRTRALIPVHLFGRAAAMPELMKVAEAHGLAVLEDAAQGLGARQGGRRLGTIGVAGAFSFFPTKPLGGCGDGGALVTDDDDIAGNARMLRIHGARKKYFNEVVAYNSRLDELQAAILRVKLPLVEKRNSSRRKLAEHYSASLSEVADIVVPEPSPEGEHIFHQYTVRVHSGRRDHLREILTISGIETHIYYPIPIHHLPPYKNEHYSCPVSERAADEVLSLPIWPSMSLSTIDEVVETVCDALR